MASTRAFLQPSGNSGLGGRQCYNSAVQAVNGDAGSLSSTHTECIPWFSEGDAQQEDALSHPHAILVSHTTAADH